MRKPVNIIFFLRKKKINVLFTSVNYKYNKRSFNSPARVYGFTGGKKKSNKFLVIITITTYHRIRKEQQLIQFISFDYVSDALVLSLNNFYLFICYYTNKLLPSNATVLWKWNAPTLAKAVFIANTTYIYWYSDHSTGKILILPNLIWNTAS